MVSKKSVLLLTLFIGLCAFALMRTANSSGVSATCHSCGSSNSYGAPKDTFSPSEDVYVTGSGFEPCKTFTAYVVNHKATWNNCDPIQSPVASAPMSSDQNGNIPATLIWPHNLTPGKYDIIIDVNGNCVYEKNIDCLDANDCNVNAGFFVIPE